MFQVKLVVIVEPKVVLRNNGRLMKFDEKLNGLMFCRVGRARNPGNTGEHAICADAFFVHTLDPSFQTVDDVDVLVLVLVEDGLGNVSGRSFPQTGQANESELERIDTVASAFGTAKTNRKPLVALYE